MEAGGEADEPGISEHDDDDVMMTNTQSKIQNHGSTAGRKAKAQHW